MIRAQTCALMGIVMLTAASAHSGEVDFSIENRIGGDSNIFRTSSRTTEDGFFEFVPVIRVREERQELNYNFRYAPIYEIFFDANGIDGWDHRASGEIDWKLGARDSIGVKSRFSQTRQVREFDTQEEVLVSDPIVDESDRERIRRASVALYYSRLFTPRFSGRIDVDFSDTDFNSRVNVDTRSYAGTLTGQYSWSHWLTLGMSGSGRYRENLGVGRQASSTSAIGNVSFSMSGNISESLEFLIQAGPSMLRTEEEDRGSLVRPEYEFDSSGLLVRAYNQAAGFCDFQGQFLLDACPFVLFDPGVPPVYTDATQSVTLSPPDDQDGQSNTSFTYFAEARLTKRWRRTNLYLIYSRFESASAGVATSSVVDSVTARITIEPSLGWFFTLRSEWSQRKTVADVVQTVTTAQAGSALNGVFPPLPGVPVPAGTSFARAFGQTTIVTSGGGSSDVVQWRASALGRRRLTKQLTLLARFQFLRSESNFSGRDFESTTLLGYVGFQFKFDPVVF